MSVFFEYPTDVSAAGKGRIACSAFSHGEHPILAVATTNGDLTLFHEEGETVTVEVHQTEAAASQAQDADLLLPASFSRPSASCLQLDWQPTAAVLACGWSDGCVSVWGERERLHREEPSVHAAAVQLLRWSPEGSRLLSADESGLLAVWSIDPRLRLSCLSRLSNDNSAVTHLAFRLPPWHPQPAAEAAAEGRRGGGALSSSPSSSACPPFFFASASGRVYYASEPSRCVQVAELGSAPLLLHHSRSHGFLAVVTADVCLHRLRWGEEEQREGGAAAAAAAAAGMQTERKVKLSIKGDGSSLQLVVAGHDLLAAANAEGCVRFWHLSGDDSFVLMFDSRHMAAPKDVILCIAFNPRKRVLCGGTAAGRIVFWRYVGQAATDGAAAEAEPSERDWEGLPAMESSCSIARIQWGPGEGLLALSNDSNVSIVLETVMQYRHVADVSAVQLTADTVQLQRGDDGRPSRFSSSIRVKGLELSASHVIVWNGKRAEVRDIRDPQQAVLVSNFASRAAVCCLHGDSVYCAVSGRLEVCNLQGVVQSVLTFAEAEGHPVAITVSGSTLAAATSAAVLKLWEIRKDGSLRVLVPGHRLLESERGLLVQSLRLNSDGSKLSLLTRRCSAEGSGLQAADSRLHVYDLELDRVFSYDFTSSYPISHCWDAADSRLIAVQSRQREGSGRAGDEPETDGAGSPQTASVTTFFCTASGLLLQDGFSIDPHADSLLALSVPHFLFLTRPSEESGSPGSGDFAPRLRLQPMRDFIGLEAVDEDTKRDLLSFSYHLTVGELDAAYRAVRRISSEAIWSNIATQCVKTKRVDVAEVCLANMGNARAVRAVREAKQEPELEAAVAQVAIQLHLLDDAERLYRECGRYDLLVELLTACGRWQDALQTAGRHDRIRLRRCHFLYARHLEQSGDWKAAMQQYELSGTHRQEVPRMLVEQQRLPELEAFIAAHQADRQLLRWWAQLAESNGQLEQAAAAYRQAGETLALVRVLCQRGDRQQAHELCSSSRDPAACFHLARQLEADGSVEAACSFYCLAHRQHQAIRLAKEAGLDAVLLSAALQSADAASKLEAAAYFEQRGLSDRAVMLYAKGGALGRAVELCFSARLFDSLRGIAEQLTDDSDPQLLSRCAAFFLQHGQHEKAVSLYLSARLYLPALQLCQQQDIRVTEAMAEKMTPPKAKDGDEAARAERERLLSSVAELCRSQGSFHLACKKFTQAGDSVSGIQCLIRSGDADKVQYYAGMSKKAEVYLLAANHLQTRDWRSDERLSSSIVSFYSRAKAWQQLSAFYSHCADLEIDEYRDYEKALQALREAVKLLIRSRQAAADEAERARRLQALDDRCRNVAAFVDARQAVKGSGGAAEMLRLCEELLAAPELPGAVRHGDVLALIAEQRCSQGQYREALDAIERMRKRSIPVPPFIDAALLQTIAAKTGVKLEEEEKTAAAAETRQAKDGQRGRAAQQQQQQGHIEDDDDDQQPAVIDEEVAD